MKSEAFTAVKLLTLAGATGLALSWGSKQKVVDRDKGCRAKGEHQGNLEAAHYNHEKDEAERRRIGLAPYDSPRAARLLCTKHHLADHVVNAGRNGLSRSENDSAIRHLVERLSVTDSGQL